MAVFKLTSEITIGIAGVNQFTFKGGNEIKVKRSLHSFIDIATIKLPGIAKVKYKNAQLPVTIPTHTIWHDGDPVTIKLGYNGQLQEEFRGFIKRRSYDTHCLLDCEGYSWQLNRNSITGSWKSISVNDLLNIAIQGTDIKRVICPDDTILTNIHAINNTGTDILNTIIRQTDHALSVFFIEPDVLWCGLLYTAYSTGQTILNNPTQNPTLNKAQVNFSLGYNIIRDNSLKKRVLNDNPVNIHYAKKLSNGQKISGLSKSFISAIKTYKKLLNHISDEQLLQKLAHEKMLKENYSGLEGNINAFLRPFALPGYTANIVDKRDSEKNGVFIIESTEVVFGMHGARRHCEIGVKVGFANTPVPSLIN